MYKKCCEDKQVNLLLTEEEGKRYYVLIKDFFKISGKQSIKAPKKVNTLE